MSIREIKFRVWDVDTHEFIDLSCGHHNQKFNDFFNDSHFVFQQYTECHDCHNKEIYEGDIVQYCDLLFPQYPVLGYIAFYGGAFFFHYKCIYENEYRRNLIGEFSKNTINIVGNMFENPELIK